MRARAAIAVALAALLGGALAQCSSGPSRPTLGKDPVGDASRAVLAAGSARIEGEVTTGSAQARVTGSWSGTVAKGRGDVSFPLTVPGGPSGAVEIRWSGGTGYIRRLVASDAVRVRAGTLGLLLRPASEKPWAKVGTVSIAALVMIPFDPPAVLDRLAELKPRAVPGTTTIAGQSAVDLRSTEDAAVIGWWTGAVIDVFVGAKNTVLRVKITGANGGLQYDVNHVGTAVKVEPPPARDVANGGGPATIALTGPYRVVRSGTTDSVAWKLLRAPAQDGSVCWRWDGSPPIPLLLSNRPDGAHCLTPPAAGADPEDTVQFVVNSAVGGRYAALAVALPPGVRSLTLGFVGGAVRAVPVASPFVWVSPVSPTMGYLGVVLANGTRLDCGAGAVGSVADLRDATLTARAAGAPWLCTQ